MRDRGPATRIGIVFPLLVALQVATVAAGEGIDLPGSRTERALTARLIEPGFENVAVHEHGDTITVWYENRIYRYELEALGRVALLSASGTDPKTVLEIVPENDGLPLLVVTAASADWLAFLRAERSPAWFEERLTVAPLEDAGDSARGRGVPRSHRSHGRVDLRIRPLFDFELGIADDPFRSSLELAPEIVTSPFPGIRWTAQVVVQIDDDLDPFARRVRPGRNTVSWGGWLPGRALGALSAGTFGGDRYGFAGQIGRLLRNGSLEITGGGDLSGRLQFTKDVTLYSEPRTWSAFLALAHRTRGIDLETRMTGARFMEGALGARLDVARRFGETEVAFFGIRTERDEVVGVALRVPLPVKRWSAPSRFRVATVPAFPFEYRDSLSDVGLQVAQFDDLDRLRKRLYPTFLLNNLRDLRNAVSD